MFDCLQPVAFTSQLMEPSGRLIQFSFLEGEGLWESDPAAHISIRPAVCLLHCCTREPGRTGYNRGKNKRRKTRGSYSQWQLKSLNHINHKWCVVNMDDSKPDRPTYSEQLWSSRGLVACPMLVSGSCHSDRPYIWDIQWSRWRGSKEHWTSFPTAMLFSRHL